MRFAWGCVAAAQYGDRFSRLPARKTRPEYFDIALFAVGFPGGRVGDAFEGPEKRATYRLTALSLKQPSVVIPATLLIALMGVFGMTRLKTELLPDINIPELTVVTTYQGAGSSAVDTAVSQTVAEQGQGHSGIKTVQTQASAGVSVVVAEFEYGSGMKEREQQLLAAISSLQLPIGSSPAGKIAGPEKLRRKSVWPTKPSSLRRPAPPRCRTIGSARLAPGQSSPIASSCLHPDRTTP